jgi:small subunit ribosomal protein S1
MKVWDEISSACERDELIEGTISQRVKGGLSVTIRGGVKAFLPGIQVDLRPIRNLDKLIGQTYQFKVIKFNKKRGNIVLSRRVLLEKERDEHQDQDLETLEEGKVVKGVIKNITEYGAFVDLGGIDGLLHITDMSWGRVNHPSELFQVGDEVTVRVLKYNPETERVSLGLKQTQEDPWSHAEEAYPPGKKVQAARSCRSPTTARSSSSSRASRASSTSARCLDQEGQAPEQAARVGQELECQVLEVDAKSKRISLGLKQLEPDPWTLFTEKYKPGDKIGGKVRSLTDYGVFIGIEEGVDGMVHKSDSRGRPRSTTPATSPQGRRRRGHHPRINHDEKKVSLGVKQLWDDPWPTIFNELPARARSSRRRSSRIVDYGVFVRIRDGIEGLIPQNEIVEEKGEDGEPKPAQGRRRGRGGDRQHRHAGARITLSMRMGERRRGGSGGGAGEAKPAAQRASRAPEEVSAAEARRRAAPSGSSSSRSSAAPWRMEYILGEKQGACIFCDFAAAPTSAYREKLVLVVQDRTRSCA